MIKFTSLNDMTSTMLGDQYLGASISTSWYGLQPTYGMTADDMNVENIVITFTWSD